MSLRDLLVDAVGQLDDVETTLTPDGAITWSRAQRPFAVLAADGASADFGLIPRSLRVCRSRSVEARRACCRTALPVPVRH